MSATSPTVADQIAALQAELGTVFPPEIAAVFASEQAALTAAGAPGGVLAIGETVPDGQLVAADGSPTTLAAQREGEPAVLVLYRGAWCPFCNVALRHYEENLAPELAERGVRMIAVSPQTPDGTAKDLADRAFSFAAVSDPGNQIARGLGVLTEPEEEIRVAQRALGVDTLALNADGTGDLPMPTVAILDAAGALRWIDVQSNYAARTEPRAILAALDAAGLR